MKLESLSFTFVFLMQKIKMEVAYQLKSLLTQQVEFLMVKLFLA